jgi:hypothetical protein
MFRSGDPAMIPPHKFHLLVNMRRTPGGMIARPGLALEFDTGIQECIDGLTEDAGLHGSALMLYPGAQAGPQANAATFAAIFPDSSDAYDEFVFALYGTASTTPGTNSPVLAFDESVDYLGPDIMSRPFVFRGQAVQFALVDRSGTPTVALLGISLPQRSLLQASACQTGNAPLPACPGASGLASGAWPYQYPVGSVEVLAYFDNPFASGSWRPDATDTVNPLASADEVIDMILTMRERIDDLRTGTSGVGEVLYFVARQTVAGPIEKRKLVRWDGSQQTNEAVTIPDDVRPGLSSQAYGPYLASAGPSGSAEDWAAYRNEGGSWTVIGGAGWTVGLGADDYSAPVFLARALSWGGRGHLLAYGTYPIGQNFVHCWPQAASEFDARRSFRSCTLSDGADVYLPVTDCLVVGPYCYAVGARISGPGGFKVLVGDFRDPLNPVPGSPFDVSRVTSPLNFIWLQEIGGRAYVGGEFLGGPNDSEPIITHRVYDVTDPASFQLVYRNDSSLIGLSRGALPAVPSDDDGGEGFQAS